MVCRTGSRGDVLILRASGSDGYNDFIYNELGVLLNSVETIVCHNAQASEDPYVLGRIAKAEAIWLAGGDQWDYVSLWRGTAVATRINTAIQERQVVIGGTSAGMAVLGGVYFTAENGTVSSIDALSNPYDTDVAISEMPFFDIPFLGRVITDTHYDDPDRKGRHLAFMARAMTDYSEPVFGLACDEYTAVCIDSDGLASIFGTYPDYDDNAYFLSPNCALLDPAPEICQAGMPLHWSHNGQAVNVYKVKGTPTGLYNFDLSDWQTGDGEIGILVC
ncbi:MAG: cyanophycinase [Saprospiraceae bacterium]